MDRAEALKREDRVVYNLLNHEDKEATRLAFATLREQEQREQREQGCGWCDHFELDPQYLIGEGNGMYKELIFHFCPMCGRKLKEGAEG